MNIIEALSAIVALIAALIAIYEFVFARRKRECRLVVILVNISYIMSIRESGCDKISTSESLEAYITELKSLLHKYNHEVFLERIGIKEQVCELIEQIESRSDHVQIIPVAELILRRTNEISIIKNSFLVKITLLLFTYVTQAYLVTIDILTACVEFIFEKFGKIVIILVIIITIFLLVYYFKDIVACLFGPMLFDGL